MSFRQEDFNEYISGRFHLTMLMEGFGVTSIINTINYILRKDKTKTIDDYDKEELESMVKEILMKGEGTLWVAK